MMTEIKLKNFIYGNVHIAPLAFFRIALGAVLFISSIRFIAHGWVKDFYITPRFHFPFYGFEWIRALPPVAMYALYGCMVLGAFMIAAGLYYRTGVILFLLSFVYAEMIDKTYYLNHYYLVSVLVLLLAFVPANRYFSIDVLRKPGLKRTHVPAWTINIFKWQLAIIYIYAGLSKINADWLIHAMPLKIWLPANQFIPVIGRWLALPVTAVLFSWCGMLFDLSIVFFLLNRRTRFLGYILVIIFHLLTAVIFQIGMFPYIMLAATTIFFSEHFHQRMLGSLSALRPSLRRGDIPRVYVSPAGYKQAGIFFFSMYFFLQLLAPIRFLLYPGKLLWTEEGYRFSWRVMLMEKGGTTFFHIVDPATGKRIEVNNRDFLTGYQERMMETQPDMMLQYAKLLKKEFEQMGIQHAGVQVESYVTLNGSGSRLFIDSSVNLAAQKETLFGHKKWILPYQP
ncbi:MAG TPA: HTTM domain-containing protein [Chitinophagaceae bacterium]|nr:HTTM domain-containing protein [Chitinophagaceae bacterium]